MTMNNRYVIVEGGHIGQNNLQSLAWTAFRFEGGQAGGKTIPVYSQVRDMLISRVGTAFHFHTSEDGDWTNNNWISNIIVGKFVRGIIMESERPDGESGINMNVFRDMSFQPDCRLRDTTEKGAIISGSSNRFDEVNFWDWQCAKTGAQMCEILPKSRQTKITGGIMSLNLIDNSSRQDSYIFDRLSAKFPPWQKVTP